MDRLWPQGTFAVAVSGGADSLALLDLAAALGRPFTALTVDHGLRPESAGDAAHVGRAAHALGVPHHVLRWEGEKPRSNLEAAARAARYRLMTAWCVAHRVPALLTAHTLDDQAETFLMRLARGSGVDGLAAMAERQDFAGLALVRPLLDVPRARLKARLVEKGLSWVEDAMNADPQFLRVRVRQAGAVLEGLGLTPARLGETARVMRRARVALEAESDTLFQAAVRVAREGHCDLAVETLAAAPDEVALRVLSRVLMGVGGLVYRPRHERLERLYDHVREGLKAGGRTLGGCRIQPLKGGAARVQREAARIDTAPVVLAPGARALWDGRFTVMLAPCALEGPAEVRALGPLAVRALEAMGDRAPDACPAGLRATLPGLWVNGVLASAPLIGLERAEGGYAPGAFHVHFSGFEREIAMARAVGDRL